MSQATLSTNICSLEFPLHEEFDLPALNWSCPLTQLTAALVKQIAQHPMVSHPAVLLQRSDYPDVEFPSPDSKIDIEVMLCSTSEALAEWGAADACGVFMAGGYPLEEGMFASKLRVGVPCNLDDLKQFVCDERQQELDPSSDRHDRSYLEAWLCTVAHEIGHALDFVAHAGGLSPAAVDVLYDAGELEFTVDDALTGIHIRDDMAEFVNDPDGAVDAMEDRVEAFGRELIQWTLPLVDQRLVTRCLTAIAPNSR